MQVTATDRGYYGGGIKEPGDTFMLDDEEHFSESWMVEGSEAKPRKRPKYTGYVAARGAAGKFVVKDAAGQMVGTFTGSKAEAETEAARLNDGGEITAKTNTDGNDDN